MAPALTLQHILWEVVCESLKPDDSDFHKGKSWKHSSVDRKVESPGGFHHGGLLFS